ncbi:ABC transporter permease [Pseudothauera rhizosphaerae]|uniref:ABC transporter permease n=1 Tax=Pseudothauera rhizosphaerae TaxID=2565932 RepID=A0A4S4AN80_9RHOO|nr:ABC transporter permease [Pseudothauera rhizosphaerae]
MAARNLLRQRRRALLALATVVGGVVAYLLAGGFIHWIFQDMRESTIHSQLGHIQITRPGYFREGLGDPYRYLLPTDTGAAGAAGSGGVRTVAPRLAFSGLVSKGEDTISFVGEGIDPALEAPITRAITIVAGRDLTGAPPESVLLGEGLAANLGAQPGDKVVLLATTADGGINAVELEVAGLFATITKAYDDTVLRAPIAVARQLMRVEGATSWVMLLDDTDATAQTVSALGTRLPADGFEIIPWSDLADFYNKTVELFSRQVGVVRLLIAFIVVLSISNTLSMAVIERTGEIGTSMAIGVRRRGILALFVSEGVLLGIAGGVIGVLAGYALGALISAIGIPMPPPPGMARGYTGQIAIPPALALDAFLLAFVTTLAASIFPAWKASRMNIVDALRHQR